MSMRAKKTRRFPKPKILLDEALSPRNKYRLLNEYCDVKHIAHDFGKSGISDSEVFKLSIKTKRIIITPNIKHFRSLVQKEYPSIIGVSSRLTPDNLDKKITSFVKSMGETDFTGKYFSITN